MPMSRNTAPTTLLLLSNLTLFLLAAAAQQQQQQQIPFQLSPLPPAASAIPTTMSPTSLTLFGDPDRPWNASEFIASDDRVRGGKSQSHLTVVVVDDDEDETTGNGNGNSSSSAAKFWGHLDITALGGAGFASQRTVDNDDDDNGVSRPAWSDLSAYDTLVLDVAHSDGKKYTVTLKDEVLPKRPDGREQSTISWEYDFVVDATVATSHQHQQVVIPFASFAPTYRGKPKPDAEPLDLKNVKRVSFMMRSFFGEQQGDFSITFKSVTAERRGGDANVAPTQGGGGFMSWIGTMLGWSA